MESEPSVLVVCSARRSTYGAVQSLMALTRAQREAGYRVEFVVWQGSEFGSDLRRQGFEVHSVKVRAKLDFFAVRRIASIAKEGGFDLIHTHLSTSSVNGCLAARMAKIPGIATVHGLSGKLSFVFARKLIAVSGGVKKHLVAQGVSAEKISVVYNGLADIEPTADKAAAKAWAGLPRDAVVLGTVSRITKMKGVEDGIRAFAMVAEKIENSHFVVVGDGDDLERCRTIAGELCLSDRVHFPGYQNDIRPFLNAMDVFLFPSHREAMGIALVEALAAGLPCVATNVGGIPEVVDSSVGVLVGVSAPSAMAAAAIEILNDPKRHRALSSAAAVRARSRFGMVKMLDDTASVYRSAIAEMKR